MRVIDFFCGCGGASEGFRQAGLEVVLGLDNDSLAAQSYKANFPESAFIDSDIRDVTLQDIEAFVGPTSASPLLFTACAPCQPFSAQNKSKGIEDERRTLLDETHAFIKYLLPDYILLENVPGMQNISMEDDGPFNRFIRVLESNGYKYSYAVVRAEQYGVPQRRKRLILLACKRFDINFPPTTHGPEKAPFQTVRDAISPYPTLENGESDAKDPLHVAAKMTALNIERIRHTPEGGDRRDWPDRLINTCHKSYSGHTDTYGRMKWDDPAPTLTTKCNSYSNGRFGHPDTSQDRAISLREAAALQTFPNNYILKGSTGAIAKQIGNAVPCELARIFGLFVLEHYRQHQEDK